MGLDNGIIIREPETIREDLEKCPTFKWDDIDGKEYQHIAYWRKCWGIRDAILSVLRKDHNSCGEHVIEYDDIRPIMRALKPFLGKDYWDENADSIWEFDEQVENMVDIYIRLAWLDDYMQKHKDLKVYFYDSY